MKGVVKFFIKYPLWSNVLIVVVLIFGAASSGFKVGPVQLPGLKKSFFPVIENKEIIIQVTMPGASPEEMEEGITMRIEEAIEGIEGIEEINSTSSENFTNVVASIYQDYDAKLALADIKNAVDGISSFPVDAEKPIVYQPKSLGNAITMVLIGEQDLRELKTLAENIEDELLAEDFISQVSVSGFPALEISIEVSEMNLLRYGLTFDDISNAVSMSNRDIAGGSVKSTEEEILIRSRNKKFTAEEIEAIILRTNADGSILTVGQIADTVVLQFADFPNKTLFNKKNAVRIDIQTLPSEDIILITDHVKQYVKDFNETNEAISLYITNDQSILLRQRLQLFLKNGGIGLLLVMLALGAFLNLRLSFWVAFGIPLSFMGMFIITNMIGITVNVISLFGMILVIGIIVDDGIVIAENIYTHFERGKSAAKAAIDGSLEVLPSIFVSISTTILVFATFFFGTGRIRDVITEMAIVVIACLAFSFVEAIFVLPTHLAHSKALTRKKNRSKLRARMDGFIDFMRYKIYGRVLHLTLKYRVITLAVVIFFCMTMRGILSGGIIESTQFPYIDRDDVTLNLALAPGTTDNITEEILLQIEEHIWDVNEDLKAQREDGLDVILSTTVNIGSGAGEEGSHAGNIAIELLDGETRDLQSFVVSQAIRDSVGMIPQATKFSIGSRTFFGSPISINLTSIDADQLDGATVMLKSKLQEYSAIKDIVDNNVAGKREVQLKLKPQANILGLNHLEISRQIRQGFFGEEIQRLQVGKDEIRVWVRYPVEDRYDLSKLEQMRIKTPLGQEFPLTELVDYHMERGVVTINRYNGQRQVNISAALANSDAAVDPIMLEIQENIIPEVLAQFPSVRVDYKGQTEEGEKFGASMRKVAPFFIIIIFCLLLFDFRSKGQAIVVLILIPIGFFCALLGHGIENKPLSLLSSYGIIALSGIIVNDAVVLINRFNSYLREGKTFYDAAHSAGVARFRAIILTSITTVAGLYPLILGKSLQAQFLIPMAISVAYGVLFGTFIILTCLPPFLMLLNDIRMVYHWLRTGYWPTREEVEPAIIEQKRLQGEEGDQFDA